MLPWAAVMVIVPVSSQPEGRSRLPVVVPAVMVILPVEPVCK